MAFHIAKSVFIAVICSLSVAITFGAPNEEKYTDQYDNVDIDEILRSDRLLNNYFNCIKTGKRCTPDGQKLREILPDALKTNCAKCSDLQKTQSEKVLVYLIKNKPAMFKELEDLFDPNHEYRANYAEEIRAQGLLLPD